MNNLKMKKDNIMEDNLMITKDLEDIPKEVKNLWGNDKVIINDLEINLIVECIKGNLVEEEDKGGVKKEMKNDLNETIFFH